MFTKTSLILAAAFQAYAAPIFHSRELASRAATQADGELAQAANFFFQSLNIESPCTTGQIACINGNFAICSTEANWEVQLCFTQGTACFATPKPGDEEGINLQCMAESEALTLIEQSGAEGGIAVDRGMTEIPSNVGEGDGDDNNDDGAPEPSCSVDAPVEIPTFEATLGDPFPSDIATDAPTSTASSDEPVCTPDPEDDGDVVDQPDNGDDNNEPDTVTATLTLILVPNPTNTGEFITSTLGSDALPSPDNSNDDDQPNVQPTDVYGDYPIENPVEAPVEAPDAESSSAAPSPSTTLTIAPPRPTSTADVIVIGPGFIPAKRAMLKVVKRDSMA